VENNVRKYVILIVSLGILFLGACATVAPETSVPADAPSEAIEPAASFELTSTVFAEGASIPVRYSCDGEDISPPLTWNDPPAGTQSFALVMDDPDAPVGTWDHWVVFNLSANMRELSEAANVAAPTGKNSWGRNDYGGPCPPEGTHRYFFKLYALDTTLDLGENTNKKQVLSAMQDHILAEAELMGTFSR